MTGANLGSCEMCSWECRYTRATQEITFGAGRYQVCEHHASHPVSPKADDFGPAPDNGTETSSQSARQSDKDVTPQCYTVLGVLAAAPEGLIREEICQRAGIVNQAACARLNTLEAQGLVIVDGEKRLAGTRRLQQVYKFRGAA
ncbi:MAG: MarR family transcriptional regulator [Hyphomonas sp.]|nr:MarR family transcriptional regulator [Hyphomonas sp.]